MTSIAKTPTLVSNEVTTVTTMGLVSTGTEHRLVVCVDLSQFGANNPDVYREVVVDEATAALALFRAVLKNPYVSWGGSDIAEMDAVWDKAVEVALPAPAELLPLEWFQLPEAEAEFDY